MLEGPFGEERLARFWSKIDKREPDECWPWLCGTDKSGYGSFKVMNYQTVAASRMALICTEWREPMGMHVLHTCDNPPCCNPAHLYFGTPLQNGHDKAERSRARTGDQTCARNGAAKLTEEQVALIVERLHQGWNNIDIAADLPIGDAMVSKIRCGHMWRPITERLGWITPRPPLTAPRSPAR
jgi:hypothetical protein